MIRRYIYIFLFSLIFTQLSAQTPLDIAFEAGSTPTVGQKFEVDVKVSDFQNLLSTQYLITWDSTVLRIDSLSFISSDLPDFDASAVSLPFQTASMTKGQMKVGWFSFSLTPQSLPDDHRLFTMAFTPLGMPCDMTDIAVTGTNDVAIEIADANFENIGATFEDLPVMIPGTDCGNPPPPPGDNIQFIFPDLAADNGTNICIPLTTTNFDSIEAFQGSFMWDPTVLTYTGVQEFGLPGLSAGFFNPDITNGTSTFIWFDNTGVTPASLADGETLFEICFDVIGMDGESSDVNLFNGNTTIQVSKAGTGSVPFDLIDGSISVGMPRQNFTITAGNVNVNQLSSEVCVDFTTQNFVNIAGIQYTMQWDPSVLNYNRVETTDSEFASTFNPADNDKLRYSWTHSTGIGLSVANNTVLYSVCFDIVGGCDESTAISFITEPSRPIEIIDNSFTALPDSQIDLNNGNVTLTCGLVLNENITNANCNGENSGAINLNITGGDAPYTVAWSPGGTQNGITTNSLLAGQGAGNYNVLVTDNNGATASATYTIQEPSPISINVNVNNSVVTINANGGNGGVTTSVTPSIADFNNVPNGTYTVTASDSRGCTETQTFTVGGSCTVAISIGDVFPAGCGADGSIQVFCSGGSGDYETFSNPPLVFSGNMFINVPSGTYEITCRDRNDLTCFATTTQIVLQSIPTLTGAVSNIMNADCNNEGADFDVNVTGGCAPYNITYELIGSGVGQQPYPSSNYLPGTYQVRVRDNSGNTVDLAQFVIGMTGVGADVDVSVVGLTPSPCTGMEGQATFSVTGGCGAFTCTLQNGTNTEGCNLTTNVDGTMTGSFDVGTYTITFTDGSGLSDSETFSIIAGSNISVSLNSASLSGIDIDVNGGTAPYSFQWFLNNNLVGTTEDLTNLTESGTYSLLVQDNQGCSTSFEVNVTDANDPSINVNPIETPFGGFATPCAEGECMGSITILIGSGTDSGPFQVTLTDEFANDFEFTFQNNGVQTIENLCAGSYEVNMTTGNGTNVNAGGTYIITSPEAIEIELDNSECPDEGLTNGFISTNVGGGVGGYIYTWNPTSGEPIEGPRIENIGTGLYTLTVEDNNGCQSQMTFDLMASCGQGACFEGKNVFTPNGDGINDVFTVSCAEGLPLNIFDRWGRLVYSTSSNLNNWNGMSDDNEELREGAYYWVIETSSNIYKGTVTLLRD